MIEGKKGLAKWIWIVIILVLIIAGYVVYTQLFGASNANS